MKTLAELKKENAAEESKETNEEPQSELEVIEEDVAEIEKEPESVENDAEVEAEEGEKESSLEAWKVEESEDSDIDEHRSDSVPLTAHTKLRSKLKGAIREKEGTIEELNAKISDLEARLSGSPVNSAKESFNLQAPTTLKRPERFDFDSDEDYYRADNDYMLQFVNQNMQAQQKALEAQEIQKKAQEDEASKVAAHYERASKLVSENGIKADIYQETDASVRRAVDSVFPGQGDLMTDRLISKLGEGSEKVFYYLGKNPQKRAELMLKLQEDQSGLSATVFLGEIKASVASGQRKNISSRAPAPSPQIKGGGSSGSASESKLKELYKKAHKKGDRQEAFNMKRQAKKQGIDTKNW